MQPFDKNCATSGNFYLFKTAGKENLILGFKLNNILDALFMNAHLSIISISSISNPQSIPISTPPSIHFNKQRGATFVDGLLLPMAKALCGHKCIFKLSCVDLWSVGHSSPKLKLLKFLGFADVFPLVKQNVAEIKHLQNYPILNPNMYE